MEQFELSASLIIERAWNYAKSKNGLLLVVMCVAIYIIEGCFSEVLSPEMDQAQLQHYAETQNFEAIGNMYGKVLRSPMYYVTSLVGILLMVGYYRNILWLVQGKSSELTLDAYKMPFMSYVNYVVVTILFGIAVGSGILLCFFPGIFLAVRLLWAPYYILDNPNSSIGEAFSASWNMTSGKFWSLLGLGIMACLVSISGLLACCIGVLFTVVVYGFVVMITYVTLNKSL